MSKSRTSRSRSRSAQKTDKTDKAGKITRNPYLNFIRDYRVANKDLSVTEVISKGAQVWRTMNDQQKSSYLAMAKEAPLRKYRSHRSRRRRRRRRRRSGRRRSRRSTDEESDNEDDVSSNNVSSDDDEKDQEQVSPAGTSSSPAPTDQK